MYKLRGVFRKQIGGGGNMGGGGGVWDKNKFRERAAQYCRVPEHIIDGPVL